MEKLITYENLRSFAYSGDRITESPKGILLSFFGLGGSSMFGEDSPRAQRLAGQGIIFVVPYYNPWSWMNRQAVDYVDEIVAVLRDKYGPLPVASTGGSMGGLSALVYTRYAAVTPSVCCANCPVCDLPYHFTERPDLPRTLYSAFGEYDCGMDEALRSASPLHLAPELPDVPYYIYHCCEDKAVNKERHSDRLVAALRASHRVEYIEVPGRGHCELPEELAQEFDDRAVSELLAAYDRLSDGGERA